MDAKALNELCLKLISNWGKEEHNLRFLKLTSEEKTTFTQEHFPLLEAGPQAKRAAFNNYDFFKQIPFVFVQPLYDLKQAIMKCQTNEDYVRVIIRIEEIEENKEATPLLKSLCEKLAKTINDHRKLTPKEIAQIQLRLLSSKSDSSVSAPSSSLPRQKSG